MYYSLEYLGLLVFLRINSCCIITRKPCSIFSDRKVTIFIFSKQGDSLCYKEVSLFHFASIFVNPNTLLLRKERKSKDAVLVARTHVHYVTQQHSPSLPLTCRFYWRNTFIFSGVLNLLKILTRKGLMHINKYFK